MTGWIRERGNFGLISRGLRHLAQKLLDWGSSLTGLGIKFNLTGDQVSRHLKRYLNDFPDDQIRESQEKEEKNFHAVILA